MEINYKYDTHGNKHFKNELSGPKGTLWHQDKEKINPVIESYIKKFNTEIIKELNRDSKKPKIFYITGSLSSVFKIDKISGLSGFTIQVNLDYIDDSKTKATMAYHSYPNTEVAEKIIVSC